MCDPMTASLAAAGISATMQVAGGFAARDAANQEARNLRMEGAQAMDVANYEGQKIRREGNRELASVDAQLAKNGVQLDSPTAIEVGKGFVDAFETDAQLALYQGRLRNWQKNAAAQQARYSGKMALIGSMVSAGATLLGSAASNGVFDAAQKTGALNASQMAPLSDGSPVGFYVVR